LNPIVGSAGQSSNTGSSSQSNSQPRVSSSIRKQSVEDETKCNVIINEVLVTNQEKSRYEYIEVSEMCGKRAKTNRKKTNMGGHMLLATTFQASEDPSLLIPGFDLMLVFSKMISQSKVWRDVTVPHKSPRENTIPDTFRVFTVGSEASPLFDDTFEDATHINSRVPNHRGSIPHETNSPNAILLVYLKRDERNKANLDLLSLNRLHNNANSNDAEYVPKKMTDPMKDFIAKHLVDIFVYGTSYTAAQLQDIESLIPHIPNDFGEYMFSSESYDSDEVDNLHSFSRCGISNLKSQPSSFRISEETPGMPNKCKPTNIVYPYKFQGAPLQRTAQKLLLNLVHSIKMSKSDPTILDGGTMEVASRLVGVSRKTFSQINRKAQDNALLTPRKRRRKFTVISKFDDFDKDFIHRVILEKFRIGVAPNAYMIYQLFMQAKKDESPNEEFQCSLSTFKRFLRLLGYRFRTIDDRAAILQREDLAKWRGIHLKMLRDNDEAEAPKELVYADEVITITYLSQ
jgi:hypothetical protein